MSSTQSISMEFALEAAAKAHAKSQQKIANLMDQVAKFQSLVEKLQGENTDLHENNAKLKRENRAVEGENHELKGKIDNGRMEILALKAMLPRQEAGSARSARSARPEPLPVAEGGGSYYATPPYPQKGMSGFENEYKDSISRLIKMGFERNSVIEALWKALGNEQNAIDKLLTQPTGKFQPQPVEEGGFVESMPVEPEPNPYVGTDHRPVDNKQYEDTIGRLLDMGYNISVATFAIDETGGNLENALRFLKEQSAA